MRDPRKYEELSEWVKNIIVYYFVDLNLDKFETTALSTTYSMYIFGRNE